MTLYPDLPGTFTVSISDSHADFFVRNDVAVLVEQDLGRYGRRAAWVPFPKPALDDLSHEDDFLPLLEAMLEPHFRPWLYPDPDWPELVLWHRLDRLERAARARARSAYWRARFRIRALIRGAKR